MTDINKVAVELVGWNNVKDVDSAISLRDMPFPLYRIGGPNNKIGGPNNRVFFLMEPNSFEQEWNPKENIEQAFILVEKAKEKFFYLTLYATASNRYIAAFSDEYNELVNISAGSPSEAITLAFIQAMKEDGKDA